MPALVSVTRESCTNGGADLFLVFSAVNAPQGEPVDAETDFRLSIQFDDVSKIPLGQPMDVANNPPNLHLSALVTAFHAPPLEPLTSFNGSASGVITISALSSGQVDGSAVLTFVDRQDESTQWGQNRLVQKALVFDVTFTNLAINPSCIPAPDTYQGIPLPTTEPDEKSAGTPPVWLILQGQAIPGTPLAFSLSTGKSGEHGELEGAKLETAAFPAGQPVSIVTPASVTVFQARLVDDPWPFPSLPGRAENMENWREPSWKPLLSRLASRSPSSHQLRSRLFRPGWWMRSRCLDPRRAA